MTTPRWLDALCVLGAIFAGHTSSNASAQDVPVHRVPLNLDAEANSKDSAGWTPSRTPNYERLVVADTVFQGRQALELRSVDGASGETYGTFGQRVDATPYRGHWVRFGAMVRARTSAPSQASLYLRVNGIRRTALALDNMTGRETRDTTWRRLEATVYVATNAESISFGALLKGTGAMWIDDATIDLLDAPPSTEISAAASALIDSVVSLLRSYSIVRHDLDWEALRLNAYSEASPAASATDAYPALFQLIYALGVPHTFLVPATSPNATAVLSTPGMVRHSPGDYAPRMEAARLGYVSVGALSPEDSILQVQFATALQSALVSLVIQRPCGWIVDLRQDTGGNMWPMLAGLGPLLGEGVAGNFVGEDTVAWGYWAGQAKEGKYALISVPNPASTFPHRPVAVLVSERTASAGEAILLAFRGRRDTRTFGSPSAGLASANSTYTLPDGSWLAVTTSMTSDRFGNTYPGPVPPDVPVASTAGGTDDVLATAVEWLNSQTACKDAK